MDCEILSTGMNHLMSLGQVATGKTLQSDMYTHEGYWEGYLVYHVLCMGFLV